MFCYVIVLASICMVNMDVMSSVEPVSSSDHSTRHSPSEHMIMVMSDYYLPGIHLENDMSVPFGHTAATTVCLFEMLCARN